MDGHFSYDPDKNYDEDTMAQQRAIEKEIAESQSLIGSVLTFDDIVEGYAKEDSVYRKKIEDLKTKYKNIRKVRGDGNCFFRAFGFAYLERLITKPEEYGRFVEIAQKSKDELIGLGFPQFTLEDFHDVFMEIVGHVKTPATVEKLVETFNDSGLSDYFVVYLRLLVSGELQKNEGEYIYFIDGQRTLKEFTSQEVEPMGKESDHIHIVALCRALGVPLSVEYMDREGDQCNRLDFSVGETNNDGTLSSLFLLYRPGHYDILYPLGS